MRAVVLPALLALAAMLVTTGAALFSPALGFVVGGLLLAAWSVLVFLEVRPVGTSG